MSVERTNELLEKLICLELHYRGVSQQSIALYLGKQKAHVNAILKPLSKRADGDK